MSFGSVSFENVRMFEVFSANAAAFSAAFHVSLESVFRVEFLPAKRTSQVGQSFLEEDVDGRRVGIFGCGCSSGGQSRLLGFPDGMHGLMTI